MSEIALAWEWAKGITAPIVGSTKIKHLESAVNSMDVELTLDEVNYFEQEIKSYHLDDKLDKNAKTKYKTTLCLKSLYV